MTVGSDTIRTLRKIFNRVSVSAKSRFKSPGPSVRPYTYNNSIRAKPGM